MLIINPAAGRGGYRKKLGEALKVFGDGGYTTTLFFTAGSGDGTRLAREHGAEYDTLVCLGGDGTLSEVIAGIVGLENAPKLGYIPMGTANDVARTLSLPKNDPLRAAKRIVSSQSHPFDVGGFGEDRYFSYIAGFGAFTKASYATPQRLKRKLGHLAYLLEAGAELKDIKPYHTKVEYDGGTIEGSFIYGSMSNSTSVAGVVKLKDDMVDLGDGLSELVLVKNPGSVVEFCKITDSVLSRRFDSEDLIILHATFAKFTFETPVKWTRDGEDGGAYTELTLRNCARAVNMIY